MNRLSRVIWVAIVLSVFVGISTKVNADMIPEAIPEATKPQEAIDKAEVVNNEPIESKGNHSCPTHCITKNIQRCTKIEDITGGDVYVEDCVDYCGMFCNTWIPEGCEMQFRSASKGKCEK